MPLSALKNKYLPIIEENLQVYIDSFEFGQSSELKHMITYHMGWYVHKGNMGAHGKRIRPLLMLLCAGAFNGDIQKIIPAAVSVELLHNFTLIHDDIEDHSPLRHGRETVWKKWGVGQAINTGDALFSIAQMSMLDLRKTCNELVAAQAASKLNQACLQLTRGQYLDLSFEEKEDIVIDTYFDMIQGKTAALIALGTMLSGLITCQVESVQHSLFTFGESLGMAFQIQDDTLGIWGDPDITGKSTASDILSHKKSLPILYGLNHHPEFKALWQKEDLTPKDIEHMSDLLEACGAKAFVQSKAEYFTKKAFNSLSALFPKKNEHADALNELTENSLNRTF